MKVTRHKALWVDTSEGPALFDCLLKEAASDNPRFFVVPGRMPCGDCGACRRALSAACLRPVDLSSVEGAFDVAERFLMPLEASEGQPSAERVAQWIVAGAVARIYEALSWSSVVPGHLCHWVSHASVHNALCGLGAAVSAARGCKTFAYVPEGAEPVPNEAVSIHPLSRAEAPGADESWRHQVRVCREGSPSDYLSEHILVLGGGVPAGLLADAAVGTQVVFVGSPGTPDTERDIKVQPAMRVHHTAQDYNPDFLAEAWALIESGEIPAAALSAFTAAPFRLE